MGEYPSAICAVHREADVSTRCGEDRGGGEGYRCPCHLRDAAGECRGLQVALQAMAGFSERGHAVNGGT